MRYFPKTDRYGWLAIGLCLLLPWVAAAGAYSWGGGSGSGNWGTAGNWDVAPTFDNTADLTFSGAVWPATFVAAVRTNRSLTFNANADTAFSIRLASAANGGQARNLLMGGGVVAPSITIDAGASAAHTLGMALGSLVLLGDLTITHNGPADFIINRPITGAFNLTKTGSGTLTLSGANTFGTARTITLGNGTINVNSTTALGAATCTNRIVGGTLDNTSGAALILGNNQPVNIAGDFTFTGLAGGTHDLSLGNGVVTLNGAAGARTITANAGTLTLGGIIRDGTATALTKEGGGTLRMNGASTYSGDTKINGGILRLGAANRIPDGAGKGNVSVNGTFDLNAFSETVNGLSGTGTVDTVAGGTPVLMVGANNQTSTFSGVITDTAGTLALTKIGSGTLTLSGANTYSGSTLVTGGTLVVNGSLGSGQVIVTNSGTLSGTGTLSGAVIAYPGSTLAPGSNAVGILTAANGVSLTGGTFRAQVTATNSGSYGQVRVTGGNVTIANTLLAISGSGYTPGNNDYLWLINNSGAGTVSGSFIGLPEGGQTNIAARTFNIYYRADFASGTTNNGNDVLLLSVPLAVAQTITNFTPSSGSSFSITDTASLFAQSSSGLTVSNFNVISGPGVLTGLTNLTFTNSGTVRVTADQAGNAYWTAAPTVTNTLVVTKATVTVTSWGTASDIAYGQALSNSTLSGATATNAAGANVPGVLTFVAPATVPNAGVNDVAVTFTPTDTVTYATVAGLVTVNVTAPPTGWFSPLGSAAPGGQWINTTNATDDNTATYASHTSPGADQWGEALWLTNGTTFKCGRVRVYSDWDPTYIDSIRLEIRIQPSGMWSNVYEGIIQNSDWSEITFASTNIDAARFSYHYVAGSIIFWLHEFQFYADTGQVNLPSCQSLEATSVEEATANLHGLLVSDGGEPCQYRFQYGLTTSYTTSTEWGGSLSGNQNFSTSISGLASNTTYHYRAQVKNGAGISSSSDRTLTTGLPLTGWVSPTGVVGSGAWTNLPNAMDDDLNSFATCYHPINTPVWSPYLYLTHSTMTCERVRFNARDMAEIDVAAIDLDLNGVWTSVYSNNTFSDKQWVEASFPRGTVTQARVKFSLNTTTYGMDWQLYEFDFYRVIGVTLSGRYDGTRRVSLAVDGQYRASFTNFATNVFTFAESVGAGSRILIYYDDDNIATNSGALVTKATGGDMTDLDLEGNTLVLRNDFGAELTSADLVTASTGDADVPYGYSGYNITIASNIALRIPSGGAFASGSNSLTICNNLIDDGSLNLVGGTVVFAGNTRVSGVSTTAFGNVSIPGSLTAHSNLMQVAGNWIKDGTFSNNNGTVDFVGATTAGGATTTAFKNIRVSGSLTAPAAWSVAGSFVNNGTFNHNNGSVVFNGSSVISGTSATTFSNVTILAGSSLTAPVGALYVDGNWSNNGTFLNNSGTLVFKSLSTATITGSNTFYNFSCTTPGKRINFAALTRQTVLGDFEVSGDSGSMVLLRSDSGSAKWNLSFPNGAQSVTYVDVRDSDALSNTVTVVGGVNSGNNNSNWVFASSRYWVGGSGNWSDTNHWALTSGGGPNASVPDSGNLVVFDVNSGAGAQCTVDRTVNVKAMILDALNTVTLHQGTNTITIQTSGFQNKAGVFSGGRANFDAAGAFQLSGGVFMAPSNNLILRSNFGHSGGVFSNNAGTVVFGGNTVMTDDVADPFANLVISNSLTAPAGTLNVAGSWTDNGSFNPNNGTVVFSGNSAISGVSTTGFNHVTISGTVTGNPSALSVAGAWVNNGVFSPAGGTILFPGNTEISGSSSSAFNNVTLSGTLAGHASKPVSIAGAWSNNGTFNPNNGTMLFSGNTEVSGSSTSTFNHVTISGSLAGHASKPVAIAGNWTQNGLFNDNNGTMVFNGRSSIGGTGTSVFHNIEIWGRMTAPATNLFITGDWVNHGAFSNHSGTVVFNGTTLLSGSMVSDFNNMRVTGTVRLDSSERIGDASAVTVLGTLNLDGKNETIGSLAGSGQVQLGSAALAVAGSSSTSFSGVISQSGDLVRKGAGMLTLSGANTYSGSTRIEAGTLKIGATNALPVVSVLSMGNTSNTGAALFDLAGCNQQVAGLRTVGTTMSMLTTNSSASLATLVLSNDLPYSYAGLIGGNVSLVKSGAGALALGDGTIGLTNTYRGATVVSYGKLIISANSVLASSTNVTVQPNGELVLIHTNNAIPDSAGIFLQSGAKVTLSNDVNETVRFLSLNGQVAAAGTWGAVNCQWTNTDYFAGSGRLVVSNGLVLPVVTITNTVSGTQLPFRTTRYTVAGNALNMSGTLWYTNSWNQSRATGTLAAGTNWTLTLNLPSKGTYTFVVCGTNDTGSVARDSITIIRKPAPLFWFGR